MPIPTPNSDEGHDDFIDRCMSNETMKNEYPDNDQRLAVCETQWKDKDAKTDGNKREVRILETAELDIEERDDEDRHDTLPKLRGYAALFDKPTELFPGLRERIAPGAFARSLNEGADVRALFNHNPDIILGRNKAGTLHLQENKKGLRTVISPPNTQAGKDIVESVRRGDISQMSFAFTVRKESWEDFKDGTSERTLQDVELHDVSPVTYPAYPDTTIAARKAEERKRVEEKPSKPVEVPKVLRHSLDTLKAQADIAVSIKRAAERFGS